MRVGLVFIELSLVAFIRLRLLWLGHVVSIVVFEIFVKGLFGLLVDLALPLLEIDLSYLLRREYGSAIVDFMGLNETFNRVADALVLMRAEVELYIRYAEVDLLVQSLPD
uniref:Uncharacterized protein n=1 Tax=Euplotes harpa TaxID=151035 RepID=A0A7S3JCB8_9SPIT